MHARTKSIFIIGDEVGEREGEANKDEMLANGQATGGLVGLQIAIQHHGRGLNIVINSALKSPRSVDRSWRPPKSLPEFGFLKTCMFCMKELSLQKEVYMYRGDEGFCSEECRAEKILLDERREFEASKRDSSLKGPYHDHGIESDRRKRISAAA